MAAGKSLFLSTEQFLNQMKALAVLVLVILVFGTLGFVLIEHNSITGAFSATLETLATGGKSGATYTPSDHLHLALKFFGAIIVWFALWTTIGMAVDGRFGEFFKEVKVLNQIKNLKGHYIVCGAGRVGKHIGSRLRKAGETVVFVEKDKDIITRLRSEGYLVIDVGPIDSTVLRDAGISKAKGLAVSLGDDSKNLLLVLEARELNPELKIAARANDTQIVHKLKKAGADYIILPEAIGGIKLADALRGKVDKDHVFTQ